MEHENLSTSQKKTIKDLKSYGLVYLATPYTKYVTGINAAFLGACHIMGDLIKHGLNNVYSPIVHLHPIAINSGLDPLDHDIWLPFNAALMAKADALLVAMMPGWEVSKGVSYEMTEFFDNDKPVFYLDPMDLSLIEAI